MIIKFNGNMNEEQFVKHVETLVKDVLSRAEMKLSEYSIRDAQVGVIFNVGDEPQYLTVEHDGTPEIFTINVKLDKNGEIERTVDNEEQSFHDEFTKAVNRGEESPINKEIESVFNDDDLEKLHTVDAGDLQEVQYKLKGTDDKVVRYYRNGVLVGEALLTKNKE